MYRYNTIQCNFLYILVRANFFSHFLLHVHPLPTQHCQWKVETWRGKENSGHLPSFAEAKQMKSLTLHNAGCLRNRLRDCSSLLHLRFNYKKVTCNALKALDAKENVTAVETLFQAPGVPQQVYITELSVYHKIMLLAL